MKLASVESITRALYDAGVPFLVVGGLVEGMAPGVPLRIVRLAALRRLKAAAGRPQDLADIAELRLLHGDVTGA